MNVGQLISELEKYPKDTLVLVDNYEDGYDTTAELTAGRVDLRPKEFREHVHWISEYELSGSDGTLAVIITGGELDD